MLWARGSPRMLGPGNLAVAVPGHCPQDPPSARDPPENAGTGGKKEIPSVLRAPRLTPQFGAITDGGQDWQQLPGLCRTVALAASPPSHPGMQQWTAWVQLLAYEQTNPLWGDPMGCGGPHIPPATCASPRLPQHTGG